MAKQVIRCGSTNTKSGKPCRRLISDEKPCRLHPTDQQIPCTQLQIVHKKRRQGENIKTTVQTRKLFLHAFETTGGNITASCEFAGIVRETYYRWMASKSSINLRFQEKVKKRKAPERIVDLAQAALQKRIAEGDTTAIIFTLKTLGKSRGFIESKDEVKKDDAHDSEIAQIRQKIQKRADERGVSFREELDLYLNLFPDIRADVRNELSEFVN